MFCFLQDSRQRYEVEYQRRAANLDKCMSELWKLERTRDKSAWDMKVRKTGKALRSVRVWEEEWGLHRLRLVTPLELHMAPEWPLPSLGGAPWDSTKGVLPGIQQATR